MNYYDEGQEQYEEIAVQSIDNMPVGAVIEYSGNDVPVGWEKVNDYSTTEINTGKTWIDGKPIYRKVVHINSLPNATATQYNHNISNMDTLVKVEGMRHFVYESNDIWSPMVWLNPGASSGIVYDSISFEVNKTGINVLVGSRDRSNSDAYFILEYTKTTD